MTPLKIVWVSPLSIRSAIARFSVSVVKRLVERGHDCHFLRSETGDRCTDPICETDTPIFSPTDQNDIVAMADVIIVNLGDNYEFHGAALNYIQDRRTILIAHDFDITNLINGVRAFQGDWYRSNLQNYVAGEAAADQIVSAPNPSGLGLFASLCAGAVAHSTFYVQELSEYCPGPVSVIPLAWETRSIPARGANLSADSGKIQCLTVGILNANKRVDRAVRAIGISKELRSQVVYNLVGHASEEERERIQAIADELNVDVRFQGAVSDVELVTFLQDADIVICLRSPVLEGASASAIEAMLYGKPVIVSDAGFYADLPDYAVEKVPANTEVPHIRQALDRLTSTDERRILGQAAHSYANEIHSPEAYAIHLETLMTQTIKASPYLEMSRRVSSVLKMMGYANNQEELDRIATIIEDTGSISRREGART